MQIPLDVYCFKDAASKSIEAEGEFSMRDAWFECAHNLASRIGTDLEPWISWQCMSSHGSGITA